MDVPAMSLELRWRRLLKKSGEVSGAFAGCAFDFLG
jgi:hypothetical protein